MRRLVVGVVALAIVVGAQVARADDAPAGDPAALELAKDLFRRGVALLDVGDYERALDYFIRSREAYPSSKNTADAALCLDHLGRYDEALEMYEELVTRFRGELDDEDQATIGPAMAALRAKVGSVEIASNVDATAMIDGRPRGGVPSVTPFRVTPGNHKLRLSREGYASLELPFTVSREQTVKLEANLIPLQGVGVLRVEDPLLPGAHVFVDDVDVGVAPWESTLKPGKHHVRTEKGDRGSALTTVVVLEGQTALARVNSADLGPSVHVTVEPATAAITIDDVALGVSKWEGRLVVGAHVLVVSEPGYRPERRPLTVERAPLTIDVKLRVDPDDPRWPRPRVGSIDVGAFGALGLTGSLGGDAEAGCAARCTSNAPAVGFLVGGRVGYQFDFGLGLELAGGYLSVRHGFARRLSAGAVTLDLEDTVAVRGGVGAAGVNYHVRLAGPIRFVARTRVGFMVADSGDPVSGTASTGGESLPLRVEGKYETLRSFQPFVEPEIGAEATFGGFAVGLGLGVAFFPAWSPPGGHAELGVTPSCPTSANPTSIGCMRNSDAIAGERVQGPFALWLPTLEATYAF